MNLLRPPISGGVFLSLILALTGAAAAGNRIVNSSFEETMINGLPEEWEIFCPPASGPLAQAGASDFTTDSTISKDGGKSVRLTSPVPVRCALLQRGIPCRPGEKWKFSVWMKGGGLDVSSDTGALARVSFLNPTDPSKNTSLASESKTARSDIADFDWRKLELEGEVPADASAIQVELFLWKGKGTVWFDQAELACEGSSEEVPVRNPDRAGKLKYRNSNRSLSERPKNGPRIIFIGDSITEMWSLKSTFPQNDFINRGIGGQLTWQMVARFPEDVLALKPETVVVLGGTNDIGGGLPADVIIENIRSMVQACKKEGVRVVVCSILPITDALAASGKKEFVRSVKRPPQKILEVNKGLRRMAEEESVPYVDYHGVLEGKDGLLPADLTTDGLHLTPKGYEVIAPVVSQALQNSAQ